EYAENAAAGVVEPGFARLRHQWQGTEPAQPLIRSHGRCGIGRTESGELQFRDPTLHRVVIASVRDEPEPAAESEQVLNGDWSLRGHGVIERTVDVPQYAAVRKLGQPLIDTFIEVQLSFIHQHQSEGCSDGFGHRGNAKNAVTL